ncbi:prepilin-type N-terminal cleavage/methylation domain-containing protein [Endothiovibrio diazotrophicus]
MSLQGPQRGFTLLELLVALTLSVLLMGLLSAALHQLGRDWTSSRGRLDDRLDLSLGLLQLERALEGALPFFYRDEEKNQPLLYFEGDADGLSWVSTLSPDQHAGFTAWRVNGELPEGADSADKGVWLRIVPAFTESPAERLDEADGQLLVPGYRAHFQYLEVDPDDEEKREWVEEWSAEENLVLPRAVRVVLEPLEEGRAPLEVVAPIAAYEHSSVRPKVTKQ